MIEAFIFINEIINNFIEQTLKAKFALKTWFFLKKEDFRLSFVSLVISLI